MARDLPCQTLLFVSRPLKDPRQQNHLASLHDADYREILIPQRRLFRPSENVCSISFSQIDHAVERTLSYLAFVALAVAIMTRVFRTP